VGVVLVAAAAYFVKNRDNSGVELTESRLPTPPTPARIVEPEPEQEPEPAAKLVPAQRLVPEPEPEPESKQRPTPNTDFGAAPTRDPEPVPKAEPEDTSPRYYTIEKGDTLYNISKNAYGNGKFWKAIYQANKNLITNPGALQPGWKLKLPRPEELAD
jgi:nucleoid-associated protein YgaU